MKLKLTFAAIPKPLLVKIITLLFLGHAVFQVNAKGYSQSKISLSVKDAEIAAVLTSIEKQSDYRFLYNGELRGVKQKVSLSVQDAEIGEVLDRLLKNTGITYQFLQNNLIAIKDAEDAAPPDHIVTGTVRGEGNAPLAGVSVQVKGTSRGTTTNENGQFSISVPENAILVFTSVGYVMQEIAVNNRATVDVSLAASAINLDQVVVIGYGTASKRDLTGSIVKIAGSEVADKPNTNPVASLQGKVAGLSVTPYGTPGKAPDIRIRGTGSTNGDAVRPLYVVDGILNDNIDYLNPNDIETIEVLKDPSSLAIFGIRGAGGVIAITTKHAKAGALNVN
ncbi:MAG TPA: carboxypeptidase-like regulatory domain-containing protein, partial [Chitinophagaceae bacterium]